MQNYEPFASLGLALAAGLVIGFERQQSAPEHRLSGESFLGGARTLPIVALLGATSVLLSRALGVWVPIVAFLGVVAFVAIAYLDDVRTSRDRGLTSEMAFLLTFVLGALALTEDVFASLRMKALTISSLAVVAAVLLSAKPVLHGFLEKTSRQDVFAVLKFLVVAVVVLPMLPDEEMGPLDAWNPRNIGLMVVLIAGISFVGYVLVRLLGAGRGMVLAGLVGGLVSSTAVTLTFSGRAAKDERLRMACAVAVVGASSLMFARVLVEVGVVHPALVGELAVPVGSMFVAGLLASFFLYRRAQDTAVGAPAEQSNPFELASAVKFAALFALVLLVSKFANEHLGSRGAYLTGIVAGTTDVDAITLSMARLAREGSVEHKVAVTTILLGVVSNTLVKAGMAAVIGGRAFMRLVLPAFGLVVVGGLVGLAAVWAAG